MPFHITNKLYDRLHRVVVLVVVRGGNVVEDDTLVVKAVVVVERGNVEVVKSGNNITGYDII